MANDHGSCSDAQASEWIDSGCCATDAHKREVHQTINQLFDENRNQFLRCPSEASDNFDCSGNAFASADSFDLAHILGSNQDSQIARSIEHFAESIDHLCDTLRLLNHIPEGTTGGDVSAPVVPQPSAGVDVPAPVVPQPSAGVDVPAPVAAAPASAGVSDLTGDAQATAGIPGQWTKIFDSNFAAGGLDQFINGSDAQGNHSLPSNGEMEYYDANNTKVMDMIDPVTGRPITVANQFVTPDLHSGEITTKQEFGGDGLYVARMKLSESGGTWPAFWGSSNGWASEIDVLEALRNGEQGGNGSNPDSTNYHIGGTWDGGHGADGAWRSVSDILAQEGQGLTLTNSFHNYAVRVQGTTLTYYFDGHEVGTINQPNAQTKMNWMVNTAVGGNWGGNGHIHDGPFGEQNGTQIEYMKFFS